ncbi:hypothetical protein D3C80_2156870 [compost metagenome]
MVTALTSCCTTMPPSSRLWPSRIMAWVFRAARCTTGMSSTSASVREPSSIWICIRIRVWFWSRRTCGVTFSVVPAVTL